MKTTVSDFPLSRSSGIINEAISKEQREELKKLEDAFWATTRNECFDLSREIEAFKIEVAYINHASEMTSVKFRIAYNPFLGFEKPLSAKIITVSGLWEKKHHTLWFIKDEITSGISFPRISHQQFDLKTASPEEISACLLEALAQTIDNTINSLHNEAAHLEDEVKRIRKVGIKK